MTTGNGAATAVNEDQVKYKTGKTSGKGVVEFAEPYAVEVSIAGTEVLLMHRWDTEAVAAKGRAKKGSAEKKSDNIESYCYRTADGELCIPGLNIKAAICEAARYMQDPRSPRKSARDLFRAGIKIKGDALLGKDTWDFIDTRKVNVQRNAVPRSRPAFNAGWSTDFVVSILLPEYIDQDTLHQAIERAGRLVGVGDFRPDFGLFRIDSYKLMTDDDVKDRKKRK